jgi:hypothetical protein
LSYVSWKDDLWPSFLFSVLVDTPRDVCSTCADLGVIPEHVDEERFPVAVPCWPCQIVCADCGQYVACEGHRFPGANRHRRHRDVEASDSQRREHPQGDAQTLRRRESLLSPLLRLVRNIEKRRQKWTNWSSWDPEESAWVDQIVIDWIRQNTECKTNKDGTQWFRLQQPEERPRNLTNGHTQHPILCLPRAPPHYRA